ncbi:MAG TPA: squalene synthase HpnC [Candidatus Binataceae bacterium]|nr:squalene synthase HpnC [Candidatus Binataceae bacterium]
MALSPVLVGEKPDAAALTEAYAWCGRLARSHYENFTIASWLMPRTMRPHLHAIYAYARVADDFADEEHDLNKLDQWQRELEDAYRGVARHPVFIALADTVRRFDIPPQPFLDLLAAFRSDVNFAGFETLADLMEYCRGSANPVGRLVLYLFGYRDSGRQALADQVCSGLQLANFWQDIAIDLGKGRIYLPRQDLARFGCSPEQLRAGVVNEAFINLMRHEIGVSRDLLGAGGALARLVDGRLRRDVLMFAGGGMAILRAIEAAGYDVFKRRPTLTRKDYLRVGWNALRGRLQA